MSLLSIFKSDKSKSKNKNENSEISKNKHTNKSKEIKNLKGKNIVDIIEKHELSDLGLILLHQMLDFQKTYKWDKHIFGDEEQVTALHVAATRPSADALKLLLSHGCPVELKTRSRGLSPFHFIAMYKGSGVENIEILVDYGIDFNVKDIAGRTALHWACIRRYHRIARELVKIERFDINAKENAGNTALMLARNLGFEQGVTLLEKTGNEQTKDSHSDGQFREPQVTADMITHLQTQNETLKRELEKLNSEVKHLKQQELNKDLQTQNENLKRELETLRSPTSRFSHGNLAAPQGKNTPYASSVSLKEPETQSFGSHSSFKRGIFQRNTHRPYIQRNTASDRRRCVSHMSGLAETTLQHFAAIPLAEHPLSEDRKKKIQANITKLLELMNADQVLVKLFEKKHIESQDYSTIKQMETTYKKNDHIIFEIIYRSSNQAYDDFAAILNEVGPRYLAALLDDRYGDSRSSTKSLNAQTCGGQETGRQEDTVPKQLYGHRAASAGTVPKQLYGHGATDPDTVPKELHSSGEETKNKWWQRR